MAQIVALTEGAFTIDRTKRFVPFNLEEDDLQQRPKGSLLVEIQPFLIITRNDILLLDTGLGFTDNEGKLQIHQNLSKHGISPSDITKVLVSHLHNDHSGGFAFPNKKIAAFENATYYINKEEWNFALGKESSSYKPENFKFLEKSKNLEFTEGKGVIDDYIHYEVTGAHCPYHQVFKIIDGEEIIFFGGDVAPQLQQMKNRFKAKYDFDGEKSMNLRQQWWKEGEKEKWTFLFYHDIKNPIYAY
jgi:glyoxylase-like metal-dependent hydrolase (beta-lactamase superfamily II)